MSGTQSFTSSPSSCKITRNAPCADGWFGPKFRNMKSSSALPRFIPNLQGRNEDVPVRSPVWLYLANTAYIRSHVQNILYVADDLPNRLATRYDGALDALRN